MSDTTSQDIQLLLDGLEVNSIRELKRIVDHYRTGIASGLAAEHRARDFQAWTATLEDIPGRPGWRSDPADPGMEWFSSDWL